MNLSATTVINTKERQTNINSLNTKSAIHLNNIYIYIYIYGPGSSVGIAIDYGLDGPESNPGGDKIFRPSRPTLGPTQPPVQ